MANTKITTSVIADGAITSAKLDTDISVSGSITGTLATAAQPNITSVGTLTGLDVAGTPTFDGLTVSDSQAGGVTALIENSNPTQTGGTLLDFIYSGVVVGRIQNRFNGNDFQTDWFTGNDGLKIFTDLAKTEKRLDIASNGDISFYDDTGTSQALFWDASAESLGIGTTSPEHTLHVNGGTANTVAQFQSTDANAYIEFLDSDAGASGCFIGGAGDDFVVLPNASEKFRVTSSGNVGIGTSSPTSLLTLGTGTFSPAATNTSALYTSATDGMVALADGYTWNTRGGAERMRIDSSGNVGIGTTNPDAKLSLHEAVNNPAIEIVPTTDNNNADTAILRLWGTKFGTANRYSEIRNVTDGSTANNELAFNTNGSEKMRIDSSGNVLVGTTDNNVTNNTGNNPGINIGVAGIKGYMAAARYQGAPLALNRLGNDGDIIGFQKDGTTVGSIGNTASDLYIGTGDVGISFYDYSTENAILPHNPDTNSAADASIDLGRGTSGSQRRFKDLYLSGGAYLGGTGSANKLDDYEEGTWTLSITTTGLAPTLTIANTTGSYTKIGRQVTATIYTGGMNISVAGSGVLKLGGLPFNVSNGNQFYSVPSFGHTNCFTSEAEGYASITTNYVVVTQVNSITNNSLVVANPRYMMMTITYFTDE